MFHNKVAELNIEEGSPSVPAALQNLKNALITLKGQGYKAVVIIHGYGSTGTGGGIKVAVRKYLGESELQGIVRMAAGGEEWESKKRAALAVCASLADWQRKIAGNAGITVAILK